MCTKGLMCLQIGIVDGNFFFFFLSGSSGGCSTRRSTLAIVNRVSAALASEHKERIEGRGGRALCARECFLSSPLLSECFFNSFMSVIRHLMCGSARIQLKFAFMKNLVRNSYWRLGRKRWGGTKAPHFFFYLVGRARRMSLERMGCESR